MGALSQARGGQSESGNLTMRMTPIVAMIAAPAIIVSEYPLTAGDVDSEVMSYTASTVGADLTYHLGMSDEGLPAQVGDLEVA
ncbi:MAG: hypothetical protein CL516_01990, partial [Actinobacteria bacterium]|nr:hypothetical protein [Actinomycetota bacterium]